MTLTDFIKAIPDTDECVLWPGYRDRDGYGKLCYRNASGQFAHRVSHLVHIGPIAVGMTVDHICFERSCVNPRHLQLLTASENSRRKKSMGRTHCAHGHEFTEKNTYYPTRSKGGDRQCRECHRIRAAIARSKKRGIAS